MKEDLPYFSHDNDARNHAKMKALRARFGWTGYGQFWALNEMIAGSARACLDLSRKVVRAGAACELGMTTDALEQFLSFLADPDECGLIEYEDGIVTTDRTQENYEHLNGERVRKRTKGKNGAEIRWNGAEKDENGAENNGKLNETKLNKTKEDIREAASASVSQFQRFIKPSLEDVSAYCQERKNRVDPQAWLDHYESNGWKVGKNPMKDWRAAVRTWERGDFAKPAVSSPSYSSTPSLKPVTMTPEEREMYARTYQRGDK
jgi:hypothetical protein